MRDGPGNPFSFFARMNRYSGDDSEADMENESVFPKVKVFLIHASTGCTCCADENHMRGPYRTSKQAKDRADCFRSRPLLASQYSKTGNYTITEHEAEELPDGRLIIGNRVLPGFYFDEQHPDGQVDDQLWNSRYGDMD